MVCILLSTYNGESFLDEQIKSLVRQEEVDFTILVRDDGSKDSTPIILDKWQQQGVLSWYKGENVGFAKSFLDLLIHAPQSDYYAFCDQDDIWLPNKLKKAIDELRQLPAGVQLYCSNLYVYRNGVNEGLWWKKEPVIDVYRCMVQNVATGCTVVFNDSLRNIVITNPPKHLYLHDFWLYQTAMLLGHVYFDMNAYIYYRQHENNQIGTKSRWVDKVRAKWKSVRTLRKQHYREDEAKELLLCYDGNIVSPKYLEIVKIVANFRKSFIDRFILLFSRRYIMNNWVDTFWLKVRVIAGYV